MRFNPAISTLVLGSFEAATILSCHELRGPRTSKETCRNQPSMTYLPLNADKASCHYSHHQIVVACSLAQTSCMPHAVGDASCMSQSMQALLHTVLLYPRVYKLLPVSLTEPGQIEHSAESSLTDSPEQENVMCGGKGRGSRTESTGREKRDRSALLVPARLSP